MNKEPENEVKGCFKDAWDFVVWSFLLGIVGAIAIYSWRYLLFVGIAVGVYFFLKYISDSWRRGTWQ